MGRLWRLEAWDLFPDMRLIPGALAWPSSEGVVVWTGRSGGWTWYDDMVEIEADVSFLCIIEDRDVRVSAIEDRLEPLLEPSVASCVALTGEPTPTAFWKRL